MSQKARKKRTRVKKVSFKDKSWFSLKAPKSYTSVSPKKTGNKLDKRFMVRGHWKRQPYGKGKLLRKHIWILPFWKGPELSEIVSKPYKVK